MNAQQRISILFNIGKPIFEVHSKDITEHINIHSALHHVVIKAFLLIKAECNNMTLVLKIKFKNF